jgi:hypothetical protein
MPDPSYSTGWLKKWQGAQSSLPRLRMVALQDSRRHENKLDGCHQWRTSYSPSSESLIKSSMVMKSSSAVLQQNKTEDWTMENEIHLHKSAPASLRTSSKIVEGCTTQVCIHCMHLIYLCSKTKVAKITGTLWLGLEERGSRRVGV